MPDLEIPPSDLEMDRILVAAACFALFVLIASGLVVGACVYVVVHALF